MAADFIGCVLRFACNSEPPHEFACWNDLFLSTLKNEATIVCFMFILCRPIPCPGLPLSVETCPHYLMFDAESVGDGDTRLKCAPPIRTGDNRDQLWAALADGTIDIVSSDHSPAPLELKMKGEGNFMLAWGGIAGVYVLGGGG